MWISFVGTATGCPSHNYRLRLSSLDFDKACIIGTVAVLPSSCPACYLPTSGEGCLARRYAHTPVPCTGTGYESMVPGTSRTYRDCSIVRWYWYWSRSLYRYTFKKPHLLAFLPVPMARRTMLCISYFRHKVELHMVAARCARCCFCCCLPCRGQVSCVEYYQEREKHLRNKIKSQKETALKTKLGTYRR